MGTLVALDVRGGEMERGARQAFLDHPRGNITGDFNVLPILSLLKGGRGRDSLARSVQRYADLDIDMEDTWKTFFAIAANFSYGREDVLATGSLIRNVTASFAIPGASLQLKRERRGAYFWAALREAPKPSAQCWQRRSRPIGTRIPSPSSGRPGPQPKQVSVL
jgi:hypothetical protein